MLASSTDAETAFQTASQIADAWRKSGVFEQVDSSMTPNLDKVRADMQKLSLAVLPQDEIRLLFEQPQTYFQAHAEAAANPFAAPSPLSLEQDWLGFGRFVADKANPQSRLQWDMDNGMLFAEAKAKLGYFCADGSQVAINFPANDALLPLMTQSRQIASENGAETLSAGGALFTAVSKAAAEKESRFDEYGRAWADLCAAVVGLPQRPSIFAVLAAGRWYVDRIGGRFISIRRSAYPDHRYRHQLGGDVGGFPVALACSVGIWAV